jgi:hypothetical protein
MLVPDRLRYVDISVEAKPRFLTCQCEKQLRCQYAQASFAVGFMLLHGPSTLYPVAAVDLISAALPLGSVDAVPMTRPLCKTAAFAVVERTVRRPTFGV